MRFTDCLFTLACLSATTCAQTTPASSFVQDLVEAQQKSADKECAGIAECCTETSDCCAGSYCDTSSFDCNVCYQDGWTCVFQACNTDADCCKEHPECRMAGFELGCMDKADVEVEANTCAATGEDCRENPCCDEATSCTQIECAPYPTCEPRSEAPSTCAKLTEDCSVNPCCAGGFCGPAEKGGSICFYNGLIQ